MKHRKLGRDSAHRKSMLENMCTDLILNEEIKTTQTRAKEVSREVEKLITLAKTDDLHTRKQAAAKLKQVTNKETGETALNKLFEEVAPRYADRNGGYTRIIKIGNRRGDNAPIVLIELV